MSDDIFVRDSNNDLAVNTVVSTEANVPYNYDDCFTVDTNGRRALRVVGSGGGDQHNLGYYATQAALEEAYPTAEAGDWAIVGATDTVWIWDTDTNAWVDSDQKGQVTSVNGQTGAVTVSEVPSQTGNAGKFLTTDGTDASWSDKPLVNTATGQYSLTIDSANPANQTQSINIGNGSQALNCSQAVVIGVKAVGKPNSVCIGYQARSNSNYGIAIGGNDNIANAAYAIQLGGNRTTNSDANTFKVGNENGNFEIMSADGSIPADRLKHAINKYSTMPTASADNLGWIVQFTGTTDSTYTHGHLYECVSDGQNPATYSWTEVSMGGGSGLPDQTGQSGKFLTTNGTDASWSDKPLVNKSSNANSVVSLKSKDSGTAFTSSGVAIFGVHTGYTNNIKAGNATVAVCSGESNFGNGSCTIVGYNSYISDKTTNSIAIGASSTIWGSNATTGQYNIAIGSSAKIGELAQAHISYAIQLGKGTNTDANTFKVGLGSSNNYELLSADGTVPTARLIKVNSTITLTAADWSSNTQTVNVTGMTATGIVLVSPDPTDQADYTSAGIYCSAQAAGTLTFTCSTTPANDIDVVVVML